MSLYIAAKKEEIADKLLLTDDPMRVKMIVANYLENAKCHNELRCMFGYTGTYKGKRISVQSIGLGAPSASIYFKELLEEYGVKTIVYVGTCASISRNLKTRDVVLVMGASTDSAMAKLRFGDVIYSAVADFDLLHLAYEKSSAMGIKVPIINIFSTDLLEDEKVNGKVKQLSDYGVMALDMETYELYTLAAKYGARVISILTVSDEILTGQKSGSAERQSTFHDMIKLAFETL